MDFFAVIHTLQQLIFAIPLNFFDIILLIAFVFYVYEESAQGALPALTNLIAIVVAFIGGLLSYHFLAVLLISLFGLSKGISDAISFLVIGSVVFLVVTNVIAYLTRAWPLIFPSIYSRIIGGVLGAISFLLISAFIIAILLSFPVSTVIKSQIRNSATGKFLFTKTLSLEVATKEIFGGAISDTLNFLTIKPDADTTITLHFKTNNGIIDEVSEKRMLALINREREKRGIASLKSDNSLRKVSRTYGVDMLKRGYFSHYTPEGLSPFDRLEHAGILYSSAAENLAFAPEVDLAMSGLMKSEGHKRNILDPSFHTIGIGVIDAGIYGKMFVQEFTD